MINIEITMGRAYVLFSQVIHHCPVVTLLSQTFQRGGRRGGEGEEEEWVRRGGGGGGVGDRVTLSLWL